MEYPLFSALKKNNIEIVVLLIDYAIKRKLNLFLSTSNELNEEDISSISIPIKIKYAFYRNDLKMNKLFN